MFTNTNYSLTAKEQKFIQRFLLNNDCGATTAGELLQDNFSCQCVDDLRSDEYSANVVGGLLSSLQEKCVIQLEERDGAVCKSNSRMALLNFEPDLYWVSSAYLETLPQDTKFSAV